MYILAAFMRNANYLVLLFILENIMLVFLIISQLIDHITIRREKSLLEEVIADYNYIIGGSDHARRRESDN